MPKRVNSTQTLPSVNAACGVYEHSKIPMEFFELVGRIISQILEVVVVHDSQNDALAQRQTSTVE
jgi:hypothetical protein